MLDRIKTLCEINGTSGREDKVRDFIISQLKPGTDYEVDNLGNLIVHVKGKKRPEKKLMMCAHMDEVGLIITYITDDGYLKFDEVGGIDPAVLIGRKVKLDSGALGVIALKHIHLCSGEEASAIPKMTELYIDIGAHTREEAQAVVSLGDNAYFCSSFEVFGTDDKFIKAKALDDRLGCAFMIELINSEPYYDVDFAFTVQEEVGARGAFAATYSINPDICIVIETTTAGDICGVSGEKRACLLGEGPVISYMDRGTVYDFELYKAFMKIAEENGIPAQTKMLIAGGNDSQAVQRVGNGTRVIAVSVPCRYLHSPVCVINRSDIESTMNLLKVVTNDRAY